VAVSLARCSWKQWEAASTGATDVMDSRMVGCAAAEEMWWFFAFLLSAKEDAVVAHCIDHGLVQVSSTAVVCALILHVSCCNQVCLWYHRCWVTNWSSAAWPR
jgi:hypothetical protein